MKNVCEYIWVAEIQQGGEDNCRFRQLAVLQDCDDAYLTAMSHILSSCDISSYQRLVTYFDYASPSDIPAVLDNWPRYCTQTSHYPEMALHSGGGNDKSKRFHSLGTGL